MTPRPASSRELAYLHHECLEAVEPWFRLKMRVANCHIPIYSIDAEGQMRQVTDGLTPAARQILERCDEMIAVIYDSYRKKAQL